MVIVNRSFVDGCRGGHLLCILFIALACGCQSVPTGPTLPVPDPAADVLTMIERATYETVTRVIAKCGEPCRENFQTTFDILDWMLDDEMTRADLVSALGWMKVEELSGPLGSLWVTENDVLIRMNNYVQPKPLGDELIHDAALAVWAGINNVYPE